MHRQFYLLFGALQILVACYLFHNEGSWLWIGFNLVGSFFDLYYYVRLLERDST